MFGIKILRDKDFALLREELTIAQRTLEDIGWVNLNAISDSENLLISGGFKKMILRSKIFYYNNPLAGNWINLTTQFTFGEGIAVPKCEDKSITEVVEIFWNNLDNKKCLTTFQAYQLLSNKLQYEGNLFFMLFDDEEGDVRVRVLNTEDVQDIICDDDDRNRPLFYKVAVKQRKYDFRNHSFENPADKIVYYADIQNADPLRYGVPPNNLAQDVRIYHVKINTDINDKFGVPELYRGLDWMQAHKDMSQDMATFIKALSQFAWKMKVKGGQAKINSIRDALATKSSLSNIANSVGRTRIENEGADMQSIPTPTGGIKNMSDGLEKMNLMVCAAAGIPYHYFGDPSSGNLATAKTMELPLIRKFVTYQKLWESIFKTILDYQIDRKIALGLLNGSYSIDQKTNREVVETTLDRTIDIDFPPILEEDLKQYAEAMGSAKKNNLVSKKLAATLFMTAANVNNIPQEIKDIEDEGGFDDPEPTMPPLGMPGVPQVDPKKKPKIKESEDPQKEIPNPADRFKRKINFTEQRMSAYRKALFGNYKRLNKEISEAIRVDELNGVVTGTVVDLDVIVRRFTNSMKESARKFFPVAIDIGEKFIRAELTDRNYKLREDNGRARDTYDNAITWNDKFVDESLGVAIESKVSDAMRKPYDTKDQFTEAVTKAAGSFSGRVEQYVGAFWTVEEMAVREAASGIGVYVNFVGPDDSHTCPGCESAVAGNPWLMDDAPLPGMQECRGMCRHALQIVDTVI